MPITNSDGDVSPVDPERPEPNKPDADGRWVTDLRGSQPPVLVQVRRWLGSALADLDNPHLLDVLIVAVELLENAYDHGRGPREIRLSHQRTPCRVRVEVEDHNPDPPRIAVPGLRGRGMTLVQQVAEDWGTLPNAHGDGKTVWATIACEGDGRTPCSRGLPSREDTRQDSGTQP
jgi:hypothetical protein